MKNASPSGALVDRDARLAELAAAIVPSLAVAVSAAAALWLSLAVIASLFASALVAVLVAGRLSAGARSLVVLVSATVLATGAELAARAWLPGVHDGLGIYLPLAILLTSGPVAAAVLEDERQGRRAARSARRALGAGLAFLGGTVLTGAAREALGAGRITLPGSVRVWTLSLPVQVAAPARGLLAPFAGLILAGYCAGLVTAAARHAARNTSRRGALPPAEAPRPAPAPAEAGEGGAP